MEALEISRKELRYAAAAVTSRIRPGSGAKSGPLSLVEEDPPLLPGPGWLRVRPILSGICGSDLATVDGQASRYFEPWVSFPFVPGHEVVGRTEDGCRVVLEPVLGHECRGFEPPFEGASPGDGDDYRHLVSGGLKPGIQTGYCSSTGGGWSTEFVAHPSQLHAVPEHLSDEAAVMVEPTAVGVHGALKANLNHDEPATVAIIGAGTMGLVILAAIKRFAPAARTIISARHPEQKLLAEQLGADQITSSDELIRAVRRATNSFEIGDALSGGADVVIDAVGSSASINQAISMTRPRGRVVLIGIPGRVSIDLTSLWHRETELVGAYTYGTETLPQGETASTFSLALEIVESANLGQLVSACYPLSRYQDAISHAAEAGRRGAVKVCFDFRTRP